jgi:HPt (histidine-containing phosphotransfer) domain-containing protein
MKYLKPVSWQTVNGKRHAQSEDLLRQKLMNTFVKDNKERYKKILEAIDAGDIKLAHRMAHTLKGNAGQLDMTALQQAAATVEYYLNSGKNLVTEEHMNSLKTELDLTLAQFADELEVIEEELKAAKDGSPEPEAEMLDDQSATELLVEMEPMLEMGNAECREFIDRLRRLPDKGSGLTANLIQQIDDLEFEQAYATFAIIKKEWNINDEQEGI